MVVKRRERFNMHMLKCYNHRCFYIIIKPVTLNTILHTKLLLSCSLSSLFCTWTCHESANYEQMKIMFSFWFLMQSEISTPQVGLNSPF